MDGKEGAGGVSQIIKKGRGGGGSIGMGPLGGGGRRWQDHGHSAGSLQLHGTVACPSFFQDSAAGELSV